MDGTSKQNLQTTEMIAEMFALDKRRVQQLAKEGIIPAVSLRPYKFDLIPTVRAYTKYLKERAEGREEKTADSVKTKADKLRAEADLKQHKAKIEEMKLKELEGKLHRSEDVEEVMNDLIFAVRGMFVALPGRLAVDVSQAESASEASVIIRKECHKALDELANYKYDPEVYRRRVMEREGWDEMPDNDNDE